MQTNFSLDIIIRPLQIHHSQWTTASNE